MSWIILNYGYCITTVNFSTVQFCTKHCGKKFNFNVIFNFLRVRWRARRSCHLLTYFAGVELASFHTAELTSLGIRKLVARLTWPIANSGLTSTSCRGNNRLESRRAATRQYQECRRGVSSSEEEFISTGRGFVRFCHIAQLKVFEPAASPWTFSPLATH